MPNPTWTLGAVRVTSVKEVELPMPGSAIVPDATPEALVPHSDWLAPHFVTEDGRLRLLIQALVVESQGRRIVVDTCVGNDKERTIPVFDQLETDFLGDLERAGFPRESIDTVLCTHLHVDHVGWNTRLEGDRWLPTFPNARYLFGRREFEYWSQAEPSEDGDILGDSVRPILDAGLADLVESDHRITEHVALEPTPGHTPGHVSVRIVSQGSEAVISGDLMHHPIQCAEPDWAVRFDVDADAARATRRAFLEKQADSGVLVLGTHFATPSAGRVVSADHAWRFDVT